MENAKENSLEEVSPESRWFNLLGHCEKIHPHDWLMLITCERGEREMKEKKIYALTQCTECDVSKCFRITLVTHL